MFLYISEPRQLTGSVCVFPRANEVPHPRTLILNVPKRLHIIPILDLRLERDGEPSVWGTQGREGLKLLRGAGQPGLKKNSN